MSSKVKLVSLNLGVRLTIQQNGHEKTMSYSCLCPSKAFENPTALLQSVCDYINEEFGTHYFVQSTGGLIAVTPAKEIKAPAPVLSQDEFNKKIKEIMS